MQTLSKTWHGGCIGKIIVLAFLAIVIPMVLSICSMCMSLLPGGVPEPSSTPRYKNLPTATESPSTPTPGPSPTPTDTPRPTNTPEPTDTPRPTNTPKPKPTAAPDYGDEIMAQVMCQGFVEDRLKAPSTADFGGIFDDRDSALWWDKESLEAIGFDTSILHSPGYWVVIGSVDSENSFGAMLRSEYSCILDYQSEGEMWRLIDISIE